MTDSTTTLMLTKLLPLVFYPVGTVILLTLLGIIVTLSRRRYALPIFFLAILWLWIASTPIFGDWAISTLERQYPAQPIGETQKSDVAIILGGAVSQPAPPRVDLDLNKSSDRVLQAVRLYKAGRVDRVLVAGGNIPWLPNIQSESELIRSLLVDWGVPLKAVAIAGKSRNTYENALEIKEIWRKEPFETALLITSAHHMPRAMAVFKKMGVPVTASATDIEALKNIPSSPLRWLPDVSALVMTTMTIKEWLGYWAYRWRGYV